MVGPHPSLPRRVSEEFRTLVQDVQGFERPGAARYSAALCAGHDDEKGSTMSINRTRGTLYKIARILGDVQAVRTGRVGRRVGRRVAGRLTGRGLGRLFR